MRTLLFCCLLLLVDWYVFQAVKLVSRDLSHSGQKTVSIVYWTVSIICIGSIAAGNIVDWHTWPKVFRMYLFAFIFINYFSKLFIIIFLLVDDITRFTRWVYLQATGAKNITPIPAEAVQGITRSDFLIKTGLVIGAIPFLSLLYGLFGSAYNFKVKRIKLPLASLPPDFEGLKILHISDIHLGSFNSTEPLQKAVDLIMEQHADVIFFTGDLVNDRSSEAEPFVDLLGRLSAPHGVFSTLGNHDYGDYVKWDSDEKKRQNLDQLKNIHSRMGWNLLTDQNSYIEKNGSRLGVLGIQNWSSHMRFPKYGNMEKATSGFEYAPVNILLSHDPSHWRGEVLDKYPKIDLMLAGHTHGFQFGIEVPGIKWSPVQYVYKEWGGLYTENDRHLYVNTGLGFLGYPGRVGILPEITVITLNKT